MTIVSAAGKEVFTTHANTVSEALAQQDIHVTEYDSLSPAGDTPITKGMEINYVAANVVKLTLMER